MLLCCRGYFVVVVIAIDVVVIDVFVIDFPTLDMHIAYTQLYVSHGPYDVSGHAALRNVPPRGDLSFHQTSTELTVVVIIVMLSLLLVA